MSFKKEDLTKDASFFHDGESTPKTVDGREQRAFWRNCEVRVFKTSDSQRPIEVYASCDGEGLISYGISLWFGPGGKVKEGS
jgi:hypothetical protein